MLLKKITFLLPLFIFVFIFSCTEDKKSAKPDVSHIESNIKIKRFEQELFAIDTSNIELGIEGQLNALKAAYPDFYEVFSQKVIADPTIGGEASTELMEDFITHPGVRRLYDTTQVIYNNVMDLEAEFSEAFQYYQYYFPERPVPEVVSFLSEFVVGTFTYGDSLLAIGWDFFLGKDFHYDYQIFPAYLQESMNKQHLVAKAMEAVATNIVGKTENKKMLDIIIDNGKVLYLKSLFMPDMPDFINMEYSPQQMQWVEKNEREIWGYFLEEELLYSTRMREFQKLVGPSPMGTSQMPPEAPGKTGNWIGWQIIKSYMNLYPETTMEELVKMTDAQEILTKSKYKPKRE